MKEIIVDEINAGKRIDAYIPSVDKDYSRTAIQRMIEEENITNFIFIYNLTQ